MLYQLISEKNHSGGTGKEPNFDLQLKRIRQDNATCLNDLVYIKTQNGNQLKVFGVPLFSLPKKRVENIRTDLGLFSESLTQGWI